jgi:hypothetical protein
VSLKNPEDPPKSVTFNCGANITLSGVTIDEHDNRYVTLGSQYLQTQTSTTSATKLRSLPQALYIATLKGTTCNTVLTDLPSSETLVDWDYDQNSNQFFVIITDQRFNSALYFVDVDTGKPKNKVAMEAGYVPVNFNLEFTSKT